MKDMIVDRVRAVSPGLLGSLVRLRGLLPATHREVTAVLAVREDVERLRMEVRELRTEIDECRRDALRIAELTDIVEQRLASPKDS